MLIDYNAGDKTMMDPQNWLSDKPDIACHLSLHSLLQVVYATMTLDSACLIMKEVMFCYYNLKGCGVVWRNCGVHFISTTVTHFSSLLYTCEVDNQNIFRT